MVALSNAAETIGNTKPKVGWETGYSISLFRSPSLMARTGAYKQLKAKNCSIVLMNKYEQTQRDQFGLDRKRKAEKKKVGGTLKFSPKDEVMSSKPARGRRHATEKSHD